MQVLLLQKETNPVINVDKQQISQARGGGHIKVCLEVFGSYVKSYVLKWCHLSQSRSGFALKMKQIGGVLERRELTRPL